MGGAGAAVELTAGGGCDAEGEVMLGLGGVGLTLTCVVCLFLCLSWLLKHSFCFFPRFFLVCALWWLLLCSDGDRALLRLYLFA